MKAIDEIRSAIAKVQHTHGLIRELPHMPEFNYIWTCPRCGSHTPSTFSCEFGPVIRLCRWCSEIRK